MPAPNLATLEDIASVIEPALQARFAAAGTLPPAFIQRQVATLPAHSIGIQFARGAATQRLHPVANGQFRRDSWAYTLTIRLGTVRKEGEADQHGFFVAQIAEIVSAARYDAAFLPYHQLVTMSDQAVTESVSAGDDSDLSVLVRTGIVAVKSDAWPVAET